jgi:hypothetical protein
MLQDNTWMIHRPVAMFSETSQKKKGPTAMTDKQFGTK